MFFPPFPPFFFLENIHLGKTVERPGKGEVYKMIWDGLMHKVNRYLWRFPPPTQLAFRIALQLSKHWKGRWWDYRYIRTKHKMAENKI